eukprot:Opistho-2@94032
MIPEELVPSNEGLLIGLGFFTMFVVCDFIGEVPRICSEQVYYVIVTWAAAYDWLNSPLTDWTDAQVLILRLSIPYFVYYTYVDARRRRWPFVVHHLLVLFFFLFPAKCPEFHYVFTVAGLMEVSNFTLNSFDLAQVYGCQPDSLLYKLFGLVFVISFIFRLVYPLPAILFLCLGITSAGDGCPQQPSWWYVVTACIFLLIWLHIKWTALICGRFVDTFVNKSGEAVRSLTADQKKTG